MIQSHVCIEWVPAHCGIEGNEMADQLAKTGATMTNETNDNPT